MITWPARPEEHTPRITGHPDEPWWTREAISFLDAYLQPHMDVLEWGAGASTLWLADRVQNVLTIEHDADWTVRVRDALVATGHDPRLYRVAQSPLGFEYYRTHWPCDVAIIDGRLRVFCCESAAHALRRGGLLVLDNADRAEYAEVHELLRDWPVRRTDNGLWRTDIWTKP